MKLFYIQVVDIVLVRQYKGNRDNSKSSTPADRIDSLENEANETRRADATRRLETRKM